MYKNRLFQTSVWFVIAFVLASCSSDGEGEAAGKVVEEYYRALTEDNVIRMKALSCAAWEENAQLEYDAFTGVKTELSDLQCSQTGSEGEVLLVKCTGAIIATYGNEQQSFDLGDGEYRVIQEAGEWRMCGQ